MRHFSKINSIIAILCDISLGASASVAISGALAGCGASGEEISDEVEIIGDAGALGAVEQAMSAPSTPGFQMGTQTGSARLRCNRTSSGQVCSVPASKNLGYCIHTVNAFPPGPAVFTAAQASRIRNLIEGLDNSLAGWTFDEVFSDCALATSGLIFYPGSVGSSGTGSSDVKDYATVAFAGISNLTEAAGVVGSFQSHSTCVVTIDVVDILAKGVNAAQDNNGLDHASDHSVLACLGIGGRSVGSAVLSSRTLFNPTAPSVFISAGEACTLNAFASGTPSTWNTTGTCASE